ncbi:universal stress protein [Fangia hongkongensis]|uniref:universal stress protein n=1 Tax=Fangia hongkongensis TaxID=270495 RepID=UPI000370F8B6|nr:universal stress protein [Fangia hongkongensis]MBK2125604.1 universal stress protein [Fangia hongkongensis]
MFEYKKIVYAVDVNDKGLDNKITEVYAYAKRKGAELSVVSVHKTIFDYGYGAGINSLSPNEVVKERMQKALDALEELYVADSETKFLLVEADSISDGIIELIHENDIDLLVLNGHHHGVLGRMGSVATKIANNAPCDVVILKNE